MVQQTDSKFSEYVLANSESGFPNPKHDKKTALRDLQNENQTTILKSDESSISKDNGPSVETIKVSGTKRPQQTPATNNGHLVYVRRKTDSEQHKNNACNKANDQASKLQEHDEKIQENNPIKDSTTCNPEPKTSEGVITVDSGKTDDCLQSDNRKEFSIQKWEERYSRLQNLLMTLDLSKQDDYLQMLHSLSSVGLSRVAVELEKRAIQLSLEEAREVQRAKLVDVLDKFPKNGDEQQPMK